MALTQKTIKLGDKEFVIQTLPASKGLEAAVALALIVAGAAEGFGDHKLDFFEIEINIGKIVGGIFKRLDIQGTPIFIKDLVLLSVITPALDPDGYEIEFSGEYETLIDLVSAIIEHNGILNPVKKKVLELTGLSLAQNSKGQESTHSSKDL